MKTQPRTQACSRYILEPQTYRTEATKIGLQYTIRELKQQRRKERSKRRHLKSEFALFQTFVFKSSIKREFRKFYVVVVHYYDIKNA